MLAPPLSFSGSCLYAFVEFCQTIEDYFQDLLLILFQILTTDKMYLRDSTCSLKVPIQQGAPSLEQSKDCRCIH